MTRKAKDLSQNQKLAIESLLGPFIAENEEMTIRMTTAFAAPEWLRASWKSAEDRGLDQLSVEEIDAEIGAVRKARPERSAAFKFLYPVRQRLDFLIQDAKHGGVAPLARFDGGRPFVKLGQQGGFHLF